MTNTVLRGGRSESTVLRSMSDERRIGMWR